MLQPLEDDFTLVLFDEVGILDAAQLITDGNNVQRDVVARHRPADNNWIVHAEVIDDVRFSRGGCGGGECADRQAVRQLVGKVRDLQIGFAKARPLLVEGAQRIDVQCSADFFVHVASSYILSKEIRPSKTHRTAAQPNEADCAAMQADFAEKENFTALETGAFPTLCRTGRRHARSYSSLISTCEQEPPLRPRMLRLISLIEPCCSRNSRNEVMSSARRPSRWSRAGKASFSSKAAYYSALLTV